MCVCGGGGVHYSLMAKSVSLLWGEGRGDKGNITLTKHDNHKELRGTITQNNTFPLLF